eukprot:TRINITY_DN87145_c0_g1_i1.p1 TRINITY_DN87145_c0_g1~~TRINITY_DN87145_c0_g1_i1.p1  ORF type:complete len:592 (+),score=100.16 TRINITY_DN87145_c0_g1_i1:66-1841(+)
MSMEGILQRFRALDANGNGTMTRRDFLSVLQSVSAEDSPNMYEQLLASADACTDDNVNYEKFIRHIFDGSVSAGNCLADSLEMVIIVHRHGARFPTKCVPGDLSWPSLPGFWDSFGGQLTPEGALQHHSLGQKLAARYRKGSCLFDGVTSSDFHRSVLVNTSPVQRTLFSAWSLLGGMFSDVPRHFAYHADRQDIDLDQAEATIQKKGQTLGIAIQVESTTAGETNDKMFHQIKTADPVSKKFKKNECLKSPVLKSMAEDPKAMALVDRLYKATGMNKLAPDKEAVKRVAGIKAFATQLAIADVHGLTPLPNVFGETFSEEDRACIRRVNDQVWGHAFRPVNSNKVSDGIGHAGAGYLGHEIGRLLEEKIAGGHSVKFAEFSGHDTDLMALASLFGVDVPQPYFTGHWMFELHRPHGGGSEWTVQVFYVIDPTSLTEAGYCALTPRRLPLDGIYIDFERCPAGSTPAEQFCAYVRRPGLALSNKLMRALGNMAESVQAGSSTWKQMLQVGVLSLTEQRKSELQEAFSFYDADASGNVSAQELDTLFRRIGKEDISHPSVEAIIELFDNDTNGELSFDDFAGLVGALEKGLL